MLDRKDPGWNLAGKKLVSNCERPFQGGPQAYNERKQF
jgi:hypothetical protein